METWDTVLLVVAGYVATFGLARLMTKRREQLIEQFCGEMEQNQGKPGKGEGSAAETTRRRAA